MNNNLLNTLNMPLEGAIDRINWCIIKMKEYKDKYFPDRAEYSSTGFGYPHSNVSKIDGIKSIYESNDMLCVDGFFIDPYEIVYASFEDYEKGIYSEERNVKKETVVYLPLNAFVSTEKELEKDIERYTKEEAQHAIKRKYDMLEYEQKEIDRKRKRLQEQELLYIN